MFELSMLLPQVASAVKFALNGAALIVVPVVNVFGTVQVVARASLGCANPMSVAAKAARTISRVRPMARTPMLQVRR